MLENGLALTCLALVWWKNARVFLYLQMCVWVNVCICEAECPNRMCQPIHIIKVVLCVHNFQASSSLLNGQEITGARHTLHLVEFICECVCVFFLTRIFLHSISFHWNHYGVLDTGSHEICHFVYLRFCVFTFAACVFFLCSWCWCLLFCLSIYLHWRWEHITDDSSHWCLWLNVLLLVVFFVHRSFENRVVKLETHVWFNFQQIANCIYFIRLCSCSRWRVVSRSECKVWN